MSSIELTDVTDELRPLSGLSYLIDDPGIEVPGTPTPPPSLTPPTKKTETSCIYSIVDN